MPLKVSEELQTKDVLNGFRVVTGRGWPFWFQRSYRQDALSGFRGATDRGCRFWFERSYRWRMPFQASEELLTENALNAFREVTDGECP